MFVRHFKSNIRVAAMGALMCVALGSTPVMAQTKNKAPISTPLSDARNIEPNSVRFSAAQFTKERPTLVLFGTNKERWAKVKAAVQQSADEGYPLQAVFIGPISEPPGIEIYAKGHHVTNPVNPDNISQAEIVKLIRDVTKQFY